MKQALKRVTKKSKLQTNLVFGWRGLYPPGFSLIYFIFTLQTNPWLLLLWQIKNCLSVILPVCFFDESGRVRRDDQSSHVKRNFWFRFSAVLLVSLQRVWKPMPSLWEGMNPQRTGACIGLQLSSAGFLSLLFRLQQSLHPCTHVFDEEKHRKEERKILASECSTDNCSTPKIKVKYEINIYFVK